MVLKCMENDMGMNERGGDGDLEESEGFRYLLGGRNQAVASWLNVEVLSTYRKSGRACKKEGRGKEKKQKKRSEQCSAMPQFLLRLPHSRSGIGSVKWHGIPQHADGVFAVGNGQR